MRNAIRMSLPLAAAIAALLASGCQGPVDPAARQQLLADLGHTSFTVYPVFVRSTQREYDPGQAARLADYLADDGLGTVTLSDQNVDFPGEWGMNQARMFRESTEALQAHVKDHPIQTEYALQAEYLIGGRGAVGGIHCYVVDRDRRLALGVLLNSHHKVFADADPQTVADCTDVLIQALRQQLDERD